MRVAAFAFGAASRDNAPVTHAPDTLNLIATIVVTAGIPALFVQLWVASHRVLALRIQVDEHDERLHALDGKPRRRRVPPLVALAALIGAHANAPGCQSHSRAIGDGAASVRTEATAARADLAAAVGTGEVGPNATPHVQSADARVERIGTLAEGITVHVAGVEDRGGLWDRIVSRLVWAGVVALCVLTAGALLYAFLPAIIAKLVCLIPALAFLIPRAIRDSAKLSDEARRDPNRLNEVIAARRASSPTFDAAYRVNRIRGRSPAGV